jgi:hypothetical protein
MMNGEGKTVITPRVESSPKKRGRPPKSSARVFNVSVPTQIRTISSLSNIVTLKLSASDIEQLEKEIGCQSTSLVADLTSNKEIKDPLPFSSFSLRDVRPYVENENTVSVSFKPTVQKKVIRTQVQTQNQAVQNSRERRDLIMNHGYTRKTKPLMEIYGVGWPAKSPYACWHCCQYFDTSPVGIPQELTPDNVFICYGNFCSYNCAKSYLTPNDDDDISSIQSRQDFISGDEQGDRLQLLELLYHIETGAPLEEPIKRAPKKLVLKMFGGHMTPEEYRTGLTTNSEYHIFKSPMVSISYLMEESTNTHDSNARAKRMKMDIANLEETYQDMIKQGKSASKMWGS